MPRPSAPAAEDDALRPARLFAGLAGARGIVAAVSGGADSTALMVLLANWAERPPVLVVSVDHGLRSEAAGEARLAAENAARLGLPARILRAPERRGAGNLQDWARRARYTLLAEAARAAGCDAIVTAHHQDDQAETFLLRLARGSGVYGLAAMADVGEVDGVRLVRPLLSVTREALAAIAASSGLAIANDPGNDDSRYDRVRWRKLRPVLAEHGLTASRLSGTAKQMRRAATALDHYARACLAEHFRADACGAVSGPAAALAGVPEEIALRALALLSQAVGGTDYTPRLDQVERLHLAILSGAVDCKRTLHGATFQAVAGSLAVRREWGRQGPPMMPAPNGSSVQWDGRFRLAVPRHEGELRVGPLGRSPRRLRAAGIGGGVLRTLPGLYREAALVALPEGVEIADEGPALGRIATQCLVGPRLGLASVQLVRSP